MKAPVRRFPLFASLIVAAACAVMVVLGFWQLGRAAEKSEELEKLEQNMVSPAIAFPNDRYDQTHLFRPSFLDCRQPGELTIEGAGKAGYRVIATCADGARVQLGTTKDPHSTINWEGGSVTGSIGQVPDSRPVILAAFAGTGREIMLIADRPQAGLAANPPRSVSEIPNNHLSYAVQWFLFAAIALVIYLLALRKRWHEG